MPSAKKKITLDQEIAIDLDELIIDITDELEPDQLISFVMDLDERVADCDFTKKLVKKLNDSLKSELDDPNDCECKVCTAIHKVLEA